MPQLAAPPQVSGRGTTTLRFTLLDGVRGVAALAVLFWHYQNFFAHPGSFPIIGNPVWRTPLHSVFWPLFDAGYLAVPVFWLISGIVFSAVYLGSAATTKEFVVNRFARLYPLHIVTLICVACLQEIIYLKYGKTLLYINYDIKHFILNLGFAAYWLPRFGYSFNGPVWSVSVEVLIYAVFWALHRRLPIYGIFGPLILSAVMSIIFLGSDNSVAECGFFFFVGCTFWMIYGAWSERPALLVSFACTMFFSGLIIGKAEPLDTLVRLPLLSGGVILMLMILERRAPAAVRKYAGMIGDNSYGMYLWHIPLQLLLFVVAADHFNVAHLARSPWFLIGYLLTVVAVARVGFVLLERPARSWLREAICPRADSVAYDHNEATEILNPELVGSAP